MEPTGTFNSAAIIIRDCLRSASGTPGSGHDPFELIIRCFPQETLDAIAWRVGAGEELEVKLYTDIFNINDFEYSGNRAPSYSENRAPSRAALRTMNCFILTSDLITSVPWHGWDAVRATLTDALAALPQNEVQLKTMNSHRLRSAVLVNCVVDRSNRHDSYGVIVDFFEANHDAVIASLPALIERHKELSEVNLGLVEDIIGGIPLSMVEGTL